ncbi:MAG: isocitrate lyase/PEP mutase family protein [Nitrososphaerales archaeon]
MVSQKEKAIEFRNLHHSGHILILPNAWDVPSARVFEDAGFPAVATSSGGVSASLGYPDGEKIPLDEMLGAVARIARSVSVPVSADMEAGFADSPRDIAKTTEGVISAGAIGLNVEDATRMNDKPLADLEAQTQKIRMIRKTADSMGIPIVINARTDAFRFAPGDKPGRVQEVIARGNAYRVAGADCIFAFGVGDPETISQIVKKIDCPVNIRAGHNAPTIPELEKLGVARASVATGPICATLGLLKKIASELKQSGTYQSLTSEAITYEELNKLATRAQGEG